MKNAAVKLNFFSPKKLNPKALILFFLGLSVLFWVLGCTSVWAFVKYHQRFSTVSYFDLLLPNRWDAYEGAKGVFYVSRAKEFARKGHYDQAFTFLKLGVLKAPHFLEGRLLLADFYVASKRPDLAKRALLQDVDWFNGNAAYFEAVLPFLSQLGDDSAIKTIAAKHLSSPHLGQATKGAIALAAAQAALNTGNYGDAEELVQLNLPVGSPERAIFLVRLDWERGYRDLALLKLRECITLWPERADLRALLVSYHRRSKNVTAWESALIEQISTDPFSFEPRIEYIRLHHEQANHERVVSEIESYLNQFKTNASAMLVLADFAANTGQPDLALRASSRLTQNRGLANAASLLVVEAQVVAGNFQTALTSIADYTAKYPEWAAQYAPVFSGLKAVAACGLGKKEDAILYLDELFSQRNLRAENLVAVSGRLSALGATDLAAETLRRAVRADPSNEVALNTLIEMQLGIPYEPDLSEHLEKFLVTRKPSREIAAKAYAALGHDEHLFTPNQARLLVDLRQLLTAKPK